MTTIGEYTLHIVLILEVIAIVIVAAAGIVYRDGRTQAPETIEKPGASPSTRLNDEDSMPVGLAPAIDRDLIEESGPVELTKQRFPSAQKADFENEGVEAFYIQVAAFRYSENAQKCRLELLSRGYRARIESPKANVDGFHRVLVGAFLDEQEVISFAEKLYEQEGLLYMVIHRSKSIKGVLSQPQFHLGVVNGIVQD